MATKTITIDLEAYGRLKRAKKGAESFSQTIKRVVKPPIDVEAWLTRVRRSPMSPKALGAVEKQLAGRRSPRTRER
ncbi:MAG: hypothetical protein JXQ75_16800 [Phycisphaerae bacterium]|nr:hypothetical protein [Phycisphaerae bacterium]